MRRKVGIVNRKLFLYENSMLRELAKYHRSSAEWNWPEFVPFEEHDPIGTRKKSPSFNPNFSLQFLRNDRLQNSKTYGEQVHPEMTVPEVLVTVDTHTGEVLRMDLFTTRFLSFNHFRQPIAALQKRLNSLGRKKLPVFDLLGEETVVIYFFVIRQRAYFLASHQPIGLLKNASRSIVDMEHEDHELEIISDSDNIIAVNGSFPFPDRPKFGVSKSMRQN